MPDPVVDVTPPVVDGTSTPSPVIATPQDAAPLSSEPTNEFRTWLLTQDEEFQNDNLLQNFKSFKDLAKGYSETKRWADGRVKLPDETTPPEEVDKFYTRLGVPEKPEEYEFTKVETPPGLAMDLAMLDKFKPVFHKFKLTKAQADGIQTEYLNTITATHNQLLQDYQARTAQQTDTLKQRWGDKFESNQELAVRTFYQYANPTIKATVEREGWGNHPDFVELFYNLGVATAEDTLRGGTPIQAQTIDQEIKSVEAKLYNLPQTDPEYKELVKKRDELYNQRYPQQE